MYTKLILCIPLLLSVQFGTAAPRSQYLQAFQNGNCAGTFTVFRETNTNITEEFPSTQFKSTWLEGLWRYIRVSENGNVTTIRRSMNGGLNNCQSSSTLHLVSVVKLANGDLDDSVLTLFPLERFDGDPVIVTKQGLSRIENFAVRSYVFTGPLSFSIFSAENFSGTAICLVVESASRNDGYGLSVNWGTEDSSIEIKVKSAKLGCNGKEQRTISTTERTRISWNSNGVEI